MKGLLIKDFKLMKGQKNFFFAIIAISLMMAMTSRGNSFHIGFLGFVGSIFSLSTISYDEFDNGNAFLFSLPITRKDYVVEKYIFGLLAGLVFLAIGTAISVITAVAGNVEKLPEVLITAGTTIPVIVLLLSIMLPFQLKFGGEKARIAIMVVIGALFAAGFLLLKVAEGMKIDANALIEKLPSFPAEVYILFLFLGAIAVLAVSFCISKRIMRKKEF